MAVPKKRHTRARSAKKLANKNLKPSFVAECNQCGSPVRKHRVCKVCGFYRGREVIEILE